MIQRIASEAHVLLRHHQVLAKLPHIPDLRSGLAINQHLPRKIHLLKARGYLIFAGIFNARQAQRRIRKIHAVFLVVYLIKRLVVRLTDRPRMRAATPDIVPLQYFGRSPLRYGVAGIAQPYPSIPYNSRSLQNVFPALPDDNLATRELWTTEPRSRPASHSRERSAPSGCERDGYGTSSGLAGCESCTAITAPSRRLCWMAFICWMAAAASAVSPSFPYRRASW